MNRNKSTEEINFSSVLLPVKFQALGHAYY